MSTSNTVLPTIPLAELDLIGDQVPHHDEADGRLIDHMTADLAIDPETNRCRWDGTPVDYGWVVGALV